jgi:hypothetical protein
MVYCRHCGVEIAETDKFCAKCGKPQQAAAAPDPVTAQLEAQVLADAGFPRAGESPKLILPAFLLCFLLGCFGAHRFYVGKIGTGILMIVTFGGLGIWWMVDLIMIILGSFKDSDGLPLKQWT